MIYFLVFFHLIVTILMIGYIFKLQKKIIKLQQKVQEHLDNHELKNYNLTEHYSLGK